MPLTPKDVYEARLHKLDKLFIAQVEFELLNKCGGSGRNAFERGIWSLIYYSAYPQFVFAHTFDDFRRIVGLGSADKCICMTAVKNYFLALGWMFEYKRDDQGADIGFELRHVFVN